MTARRNEAKTELLLAEMDQVRTELREAIEELATITVEVPLKGIIVNKFIRCGKTYCRCMHGGSPHGPYPHLQWWEEGKLKTKYLNRRNVGEHRSRLEASKRRVDLLRLHKTLLVKERRLERLLKARTQAEGPSPK